MSFAAEKIYLDEEISMFKYLKYYLAILLCGAISLALLVMAFIAVLPKGTNDSFAVYEKVEV